MTRWICWSPSASTETDKAAHCLVLIRVKNMRNARLLRGTDLQGLRYRRQHSQYPSAGQGGRHVFRIAKETHTIKFLQVQSSSAPQSIHLNPKGTNIKMNDRRKRISEKSKITICLVGLALLVNGCANDNNSNKQDENSASTTESTISTNLSPVEVKQKLNDAGLSCEDNEVKEYERSQALQCTEKVLISTYSNNRQAESAAKFHTENGKFAIADQNWILLSDKKKDLEPYADKLSSEIHGNQ